MRRHAGARLRRFVVAACCLLLATRAVAQPVQQVAPPFTPVLDADGFMRASPGRPLVLPADHGSHPETRTEWWYLTGVLHAAVEDGETATNSADGDPQFGFQATWFRRALIAELPAGRSPLATRDVMLYHGALTDVAAGSLSFHEQSCRAYPPWAHAATGALDVALLDSSLTLRAANGAPGSVDADESSGEAHLHCRVGDGELDVVIDLAACAPLLHGAEPGLSLKGALPGQASWYYSLPRLPLRGTLRRPGQPDLAVTGHAWFDHEFGSSQLSDGQVGWDWFSAALDDGSDLMLYRMRRADGSADESSAGTFREPRDGGAPPQEPRTTYLGSPDFTLESTGTWRSPSSGAVYPSGWTLRVPAEALMLTVTPMVLDQELRTPSSTGVTYWEGLCSFSGERAGHAVKGFGYVELVGYERSFTERL